ncbi:MAG: PAS domain-containing sensor histidine kinase [Candidatus Dojkabacteria bacterium]
MGDLVHPEDLADVQRIIGKSTETRFSFFTRLLSPNGTVIYVEERLTSYDGGFRHTEFKDITAETLRLKSANLKLELANKLAQVSQVDEVLQNAVQYVIEIGQADSGLILLDNSLSATHNIDSLDIDGLRSSENLRAVMLSGLPIFSTEDSDLAVQLGIEHLIDEHYLTCILPVRSNSSGVIGVILLFTQDSKPTHLNAISDLAGVPHNIGEVIARIQSELRYKELFENITTGIAMGRLVFDSEGKVLDFVLSKANLYITKQTGKDLTDLLEIPVGETPLGGKNGNRPVLEMLKAVYNGSQEYTVEVFQEFLGIWIRVTLLSMSNKEFVLVVDDITEEKRLEELELEAAMVKLRGEILGAVSHDLKSPLTVLYLILETSKMIMKKISESAIDIDFSKVNEKIEMGKTVLGRMSSLVNSILEFSSLEKLASLEMQQIDFVQYISKLFKTEIELLSVKKKQNISLHLGCVSPVNVKIDNNNFTRIITNLVGNAIRYTQENGQIIIDVNLNETNVILEVQDNGAGMSNEVMKKIFEPFFRADQRINMHNDDGEINAGLGLATVRKLCELHGAKIEVESVEGKGSTFRVILPLAKVQSEG